MGWFTKKNNQLLDITFKKHNDEWLTKHFKKQIIRKLYQTIVRVNSYLIYNISMSEYVDYFKILEKEFDKTFNKKRIEIEQHLGSKPSTEIVVKKMEDIYIRVKNNIIIEIKEVGESL